MTLRKIAQIGHPVLRQRAREVSRAELETPEVQLDEGLQRTIDHFRGLVR